MTEPNSYNSIDALFKKAFDGLPETPSPDGWDTPSGKVWEHVQTRIETPRNGWSAQTLGLIAAFAVVLSIGLYLVLFSVSKTPNNVTSPAEVPASVVTTPPIRVETPVVSSPINAAPAAPNLKKSVKKAAAPLTQKASTTNKVAGKNAAELVLPIEKRPTQHSAALPLPGSKPPASPNTTVARKQQSTQTPLPYLPLLRSKPQVPPIPASLRFKPQ